MMRYFSLLFLVAYVFGAAAQTTESDTISISKRMLSADFNYQGKNLSLMKLENLCAVYPDALEEITLAKRNNNPAILMTLAGAVLIGYTGIKWLMGDDPQWYFAGGGVVLIGATIPLYRGARNHSVNAARIYNYETRHKKKK